MFGEYAQVASYMQPAHNAAYQMNLLHQKSLPAYLQPNYHLSQPFDQGKVKNGLNEDFIMIAEFSELEGPKPLMTIPKDGGADFDQNNFAVRILAVDHQNPTDGFSISEDAQIVVSDIEAGVFAFVHHMVLFDNTARGFVRPYCIAFITADQRKLMHFYEELSWKFKKVARLLKYGNKMVFVGDLERHLKDLEYTKNVHLSQVCKIRLRNTEGSEDQILNARKNAENELYRGLETIQQSSSEINYILSILKPLLPDRRLEARFRLLEDRAYQGSSSVGLDKMSLPESGFTEFSTVDELDFRYGSLSEPRISPLALFKPREYKPVLVETKRAKRFNAPLRGLHELCSWGAKEGLKKLRLIHMYFKRDVAVLELHKNESRLFRPRCTSIYHGQCISGNFLSGVQMKKSLDAAEEAEQGWSMLCSHQWGSFGSLESEYSFKSADSYPSMYDHKEASPSSFHTYDSLNGNIFQSASTSPEKEFSLLMSNEYYPDLKTCQEEDISYAESKVSCDLFQNEKVAGPGYVDRMFMAANGELSQEYLRTLSDSENSCSEKAEICDTTAIHASHVGETVLSRERNLISKTADSDQNDSCKNMDVKIQEDNDNNNINNDLNGRENNTSVNETSKVCGGCSVILDQSAHKTSSSCTESENLQIQDEIADKCLADIALCNDLSDRGMQFIAYNNSHDGISITAQSSTHASNTSHANGTRDKNTDITILQNTTQCLSENPKHSSKKIFKTDEDSRTQIEKFGFLPRNIQPGSVDSSSDTENNPVPVVAHRDHIVASKNGQIQHWDNILPAMLDQEQNQLYNGKVNNLLGTSLQVPMKPQNGLQIQQSDIEMSHKDNEKSQNSSEVLQTKLEMPQNGSESPHASVMPLEKSFAVKSSIDDPGNLPPPETNGHLAHIGSRKITASSKLSHSLSDYSKFDHHITKMIHTRSGKFDQPGLHNDDDLMKARTESDVSSVFTEISIQDLFPSLNSATSEPLDDGEATLVNNENLQAPQNMGAWKPRCAAYTVGDWINNLSQGRPGFGLSDVLSTYQCLDHVIFSLLCGRPVLVAGSAKMEHEIIKIVNALSTFVPLTRRKSHAILEWTSKPLKITDLIKLKLVGLCRPEKRLLDSFIPSAIKKACTVVDLERRTIIAPPYQGQFITSLLSKRNTFRSDVQLLAYIEWWLMDILAKAFIFFHSFCLGSTGSVLYSHSPKDQRDAYHVIVSGIMSRIGVKDCDCEIIEHLTEMVKLAKMESRVCQGVESGSVVTPLTLRHKLCERFRC